MLQKNKTQYSKIFLLLLILFAFNLNSFAQYNFKDTISPTDNDSLPIKNLIRSFILNKNYNGEASFVYIGFVNDSTIKTDEYKSTVYRTINLKLFEPILDSSTVVYYVIGLYNKIIYGPKEHEFLSTYNVILADSNLTPLYISNSIKTHGQYSLILEKVIDNSILSFYTIDQNKLQYFHLMCPETSIENNNDPLYQINFKERRFCFFQIPADQISNDFHEIIIAPSHCQFYCRCGYGSID